MPTINQLKQRAKNALRGKYFRVALMFTFVTVFEEAFGLKLVTEHFFSKVMNYPFTLYGYTYNYPYLRPFGIGNFFTVICAIMALVSLVCKVGEIRAAHKLLNGGDPTLGTFFPFRLVGKVIVMNLLRALLVLAWSMLFIFPGIIAAYRYSMADHLLAEEPELSAVEALRQSRERMHGYKMSLFTLQLSFLGWFLLCQAAGYGLALLVEEFTDGFAIEVIYEMICWVMAAFLTAYQETTTTAFYESIPEPGHDSTYEAPRADGKEPVAEETVKVDNLSRGQELYLMYKCSKALMARSGVLEEYEATGATSFNEDIWRRDYIGQLMRRFDRDPEALSDLLRLSGEYALDDLNDRVLERIGRHQREESLSAAETLNMVGRVATVLTDPAYTGDAGFVSRKKAQIADMAERLVPRLESENAAGNWREQLEAIRNMCR